MKNTTRAMIAHARTPAATPMPAIAALDRPSSSSGIGLVAGVVVTAGLAVSLLEDGIVDLVGAGMKEAGGSDVAILKS
jgi:hypothetical protein